MEHTDFAARDAVAASGADLRHGSVRAFYVRRDDHVRVPDVAWFRDAADYWSKPEIADSVFATVAAERPSCSR